MKHAALSLLMLLGAGIVHADGRDLEHYLAVLDSHPRVQAVLESHKSMQYRADGAMGLPDPSISLGVDNVPVSDPAFDQYLPSAKVIGFSQSIPNSKGRKAQKEVFLSSAQSIGLSAEYERSRLHSLFISRVADLQRVRLQTEYEEKKKDIIAQLQSYYDGQLLAGQPVYEKTFSMELKETDIEQRLNSLQAEKSAIEADLLQLVGEVPELDETTVREKKWNGDLKGLYPVQLASRYIDEQKARTDLADSEYHPDFGVVATYKIREDGANDSFDGDDWFSLQFRMSVPLWYSTNQRPKVEAAQSLKKSAEHSYREAVLQWQMETTRIESEKHASFLNIKVLKRKDMVLQEKIQAMERTYSAGQTSLEPVLQAELARLTLRSQIAGEQAKLARFSEELNSHIQTKTIKNP